MQDGPPLPPPGQEHLKDPAFEADAAETWQLPLPEMVSPHRLWQLLDSIPPDEYGNKNFNPEQRDEFARSIKHLGVLTEKPSDESVQKGIERARGLISSGLDRSELSGYSFMANERFRYITEDKPAVRLNWQSDLPLYVRPDKLVGAGTFINWQGRMPGANISWTDKDGQVRTTPSIEAIEDYASRDTPLPQSDFLAFDLVITDSEAFVFAGVNGHRSAAAKLRNEPVGVSSLNLYDMRTGAPE